MTKRPQTHFAICSFLLAAPACAAADKTGSFSISLLVDTDAPSYFRVPIPKGLAGVLLNVEATRPIAIMVAAGYFPTESHFDISNFPDWSRGRQVSSLFIPAELVETSPCEDRVGEHLTACLKRADTSSGVGFRCGGEFAAEAAWDVTATTATFPERESAFMCDKYVDDCSNSFCDSDRGPTICSGLDSSDCLCQRGFCAVAGRCIDADFADPGCMKVTGRTCPFYTCDVSIGPTNCEDGLCICRQGYCSVNGVCQPGPLCAELNSHGVCDGGRTHRHQSDTAVTNVRVTAATSRNVTAATSDEACCQRLNTARVVSSSRLARCAAQHFFGLQAAIGRSLSVPLLSARGDTEHLDRIAVVALRSDELPSNSSSLFNDGLAEAASVEASVRLTTTIITEWDAKNASAQARGSDVADTSSFLTLQELLSHSWVGKRFEPALQLLEVPVLTPHGKANLPTINAPAGALPVRLRRDRLVLLRLSDEGITGTRAIKSGLLLLHVVGLPPGSHVLYGRSWPEPRSLMDLSPARLVAEAGGSSVWMATQMNTRHFAILPGADAVTTAFFAVHALPMMPPALFPASFSPVVVSTLSTPAPEVIAHSLHVPLWTIFSGVLMLAFTLLVFVFLPHGFGRASNRSVPYAAVADWDIDDNTGQAPGTLAPAHQRIFPSSCSTAVVQKVLVLKDQITSRLLSISTRLGSSRRSKRTEFDSSTDDEELEFGARGRGDDDISVRRSLLGGGDRGEIDVEEESESVVTASTATAAPLEALPRRPGCCTSGVIACASSGQLRSAVDAMGANDRAAMAALMKLRPAARDSLGDDAEEAYDSCCGPLVGTHRADMLSR
eukprot:TRINITY_DN33296_c0_g1_i1.p1 TRINITY_DN33296_c0_g1~~TRINITY_DN33296_c0_g1_i1.p1  ORF type:complete len:839 (-),score=99.80 TRINITY_DN33296_c0_g1_i1:78-2594(-)